MRLELASAGDNPLQLPGVVGAADVRARVAEPFEGGHGLGGALEPGFQSAIRALGFAADPFDELRGSPASRRRSAGHSLGRAPAQHVHVAEHRHVDPALVEIPLQLGKLLRVPSDLRNCEVRAGSDLLFELEILVKAVLPCVLERRDRDGDMKGDALFLAQLRDQGDQLHRIEVEDRLALSSRSDSHRSARTR